MSKGKSVHAYRKNDDCKTFYEVINNAAVEHFILIFISKNTFMETSPKLIKLLQ